MIDLHTHSTFSDGSYTPTELVEKASEIGLEGLALTDHDTVDGLEELLHAECDTQIERIAGVELSAEYSPGTMHILGYHIDIHNEDLCAKLALIREARETRNYRILEKLNELGLELTWDEVAEYAGSEVVGRPHFAQAMIARGYCKDKQTVFDKYLAKGKQAYVNRARLDPGECIELIRNAGGVVVLAHPITLKLTKRKTRELIEQLVDLGLQGLECYYSEYSPKNHKEMLELATDLGLVMTGGSDFHGAANPAVKLGRGFGGLKVPNKLLEPLRAKTTVSRGSL